MAYYSKYSGKEVDERLDRVDSIPTKISQLLNDKDYITEIELIAILDRIPIVDFSKIPIDGDTIYWDNEVLKARINPEDIPLGSYWEKRTDANGDEYIYTELPVITKHGITMYGNVDNIDIEDIYGDLSAALSSIVDGTTIIMDNGTLKINPNIDLGGASTWGELEGIPQWILDAGNNKPKYSYDEITGLDQYVQNITTGFVTTDDTEQDISGKKNFIKGLSINGLDIHNSQDDVIYIDANLVVRGGITMFALDEVDIPGVMDYIEDASYNKKGIASFDSNYFTITNGHVTLISDNVGLDTSKLEQYLTTNKYATQDWVTSQSYASSSDLVVLSTKLNDFLEGSDTDNIINKWKELETFLTGLDGSNDLATILGWKADKTYVDNTFVTISGDEDVTGKKNFVKGLSINGVNLYNTKDDIVYLEGNLVVKGGVTMYALDDATVDSIIDSLPTASTSAKGIASFDGNYFVVDNNGKVTLIPDSVGLNEERLYTYLTSNKYATQDWVEEKKYLQTHQAIHSLTIKKNGTSLGVYTPNSSAKEIDITTPTKVSELDNDSKFISGITSAMVVGALGYTPYDSASFTKANIKSTLGISDWALATSKPSYKTSEVSEETNLYFTNARAISALKSITDGLATDIATKWTQDDSKITNWDTAFGWGDHSKNDYTTNKYVNDTFVTIGGTIEQTITGDKNFTGKLKVNGGTITYSSDGYWKLEGDLLVTGGVTMYGNDSEFVPSTIMDAILYDDTTLGINANGELYVKGGTGGVSGDYLPLSGGVMTGWIGLPKGTAIYDGSTYTLFGFNTSGDDLLVGHNLHNLTIRSYDTTIQTRGDSLRHYNINTGVTSTILDSSNWSQYVTAGDGGSYLPLSGGTISNSAFGALTIHRANGAYGAAIRFSNNNDGQLGLIGINGSGNASNQRQAIFEDYLGVQHTLWHSGNFTPSNYLPLTGGSMTGDIGLSSLSIGSYDKSFASAGVIEKLNYMSDVSNYRTFLGSIYQNDSWNTIISVRHRNGVADGNLYGFYLLSPVMTYKSNTDLYFRKQDYYGWGDSYKILHSGNISSYNAGSATKLQTARAIFGQSFDGTGNVDGDLTTNGGITMRTGTAFDASKYLTLTNNASQYGRIGITFNGSTQDSNDNWGEGGRSIISFRRKYGTATSYAFSYAIQHNLVDNTLGILYGSNVGILLNGAGNVGIGTTNPESYKLYVNGNIYSIGSYRSAAMIHATGALRSDTGLELYQATPYIDFHFNSSTADYTTRIIESSSGVLSLIGSLIVSGGITMYSDERKKTILNYVELSLKQIAEAPLIEHYYNSDTNKTTHVGSIAQYWAEMNDWFCKKDSEGYYTMEIQNAALASAISVARELVKFETETDRRIRLLEEENKRLKEEVEYLKLNVA